MIILASLDGLINFIAVKKPGFALFTPLVILAQNDDEILEEASTPLLRTVDLESTVESYRSKAFVEIAFRGERHTSPFLIWNQIEA
ncbi:MAG: hypothetical protein AAGJ81_04210 [Verrucomicrobiota bacterium]